MPAILVVLVGLALVIFVGTMLEGRRSDDP